MFEPYDNQLTLVRAACITYILAAVSTEEDQSIELDENMMLPFFMFAGFGNPTVRIALPDNYDGNVAGLASEHIQLSWINGKVKGCELCTDDLLVLADTIYRQLN